MQIEVLPDCRSHLDWYVRYRDVPAKHATAIALDLLYTYQFWAVRVRSEAGCLVRVYDRAKDVRNAFNPL